MSEWTNATIKELLGNDADNVRVFVGNHYNIHTGETVYDVSVTLGCHVVVPTEVRMENTYGAVQEEVAKTVIQRIEEYVNEQQEATRTRGFHGQRHAEVVLQGFRSPTAFVERGSGRAEEVGSPPSKPDVVVRDGEAGRVAVCQTADLTPLHPTRVAKCGKCTMDFCTACDPTGCPNCARCAA